LVERGDSVEWFSASFPGAASDETIDGVHIVRTGRQWTVHWSAFRRYRGKLSKNFDVVIDEVNTIPFFTPLWSDIPVVMFIHQLAREVWWYESPFPINALGFLAEPLYLRLYRRVPVLTVSQSTKQDLNELGFTASMTVLPEGVEPLTALRVAKSSRPTFLYVGRLSPSKRVSDVIRAFAAFCKVSESGELRLLGDGRPAYVRELRQLADNLGMSERVRFLGRVPTSEKHLEMAVAHVLLLASAREGWGLVVTEANAFGTPAVAYDVPGLRDSIRDQETGLLVQPSPKRLAEAMVRLWQDRDLYRRLSSAAKTWSATFTFDKTTEVCRVSLLKTLATLQPPEGTPEVTHGSV
jgi:glycosyltransferase involved in cell wall biosynthesis